MYLCETLQTTYTMRIALYVRVSTDAQEYQRQKADLTAKAEREGNEIVYFFSDKVSGFKNEREREDLPKLLLLTKNEIDSVYITEFSRLSRNPTHLKELIDHFTERGINVYSLTQNLNTLNADGKVEFSTALIISIYSEYGKYEIDLKNLRQKSGRKHSILSNGNTYTGKPSYGYKNEGEKRHRKLVINQKEAEVVEYIFKSYANGHSIKEILLYLNLHRIPTRNTDFIKHETFKLNKTTTISKNEIKWGKSAVRNILRNTAYCGYIILKTGERVNTPKIVSEELFLKCKSEIKARIVGADKTRKHDYLLRSYLVCGFCGKKYVGTLSHGFHLYKCSDKIQVKYNTYVGCRNTSVTRNIIEPIVWEAIKGAFVELRQSQIKTGNINMFSMKISGCNSQIDIIDEELRSLAKQSERLLMLYTKGLYSDSQIESEQRNVNSQISILGRKKRQLEMEINGYKEALSAISAIDNRPFEFDESYESKKNAMKELVKEVVVYMVDTKYTVYKISLIAGYDTYIIREVRTKKFCVINGILFNYNPQNKLFTHQGLEPTTAFEFRPITIEVTPKDLLDNTLRIESAEQVINSN